MSSYIGQNVKVVRAEVRGNHLKITTLPLDYDGNDARVGHDEVAMFVGGDQTPRDAAKVIIDGLLPMGGEVVVLPPADVSSLEALASTGGECSRKLAARLLSQAIKREVDILQNHPAYAG